jgi:hypothetical protein
MKTNAPMQFGLSTLLLLFVVLWSSLVVFGLVWGIAVTVYVSIAVACIRNAKSPQTVLPDIVLAVVYAVLLFGSIWLMLIIFYEIGMTHRNVLEHRTEIEPRSGWTNGAALVVWVASVGWLLVHALRSRKKRTVPPINESQQNKP